MNQRTAWKFSTAALVFASATLAAQAQRPDLSVDTQTDGFPQNPAIAPAPATQCQKVPPGSIPAPSGTYMRQWMARQATKASMDMFVIYGYEWFEGGLTLGPFGYRHVAEIARRLACVPFPVVIQPDQRPQQNETRRQLIIQYLAMNGVPNAAERVIVAFPRAEGLYGEEAARIYYSMIGQSAAGGGYGGAGFGTGGLGGAAPSGGYGGSLGGAGLGGGGGFGGGMTTVP